MNSGLSLDARVSSTPEDTPLERTQILAASTKNACDAPSHQKAPL